MRKTALEGAPCEYSDVSHLLEDRREVAEALGATAEAIATALRRCGDFSCGAARCCERRSCRRPYGSAVEWLLGKFLD